MNEGAAELTRNRSGRSCGEWRDLYSITEVPETGDEMSALGTIWGALGPRVQLIDGLIRTKNRADLGADAGAPAVFRSFHPLRVGPGRWETDRNFKSTALVHRFRSSHHIAAHSFASFGIKGALANL